MKIRSRIRTIGGHVYRDFVVDMGKIDGKRKQRVFTVRSEADEFLEKQKNLKKNHGEAALSLSPSTALRYAAVEERLATVGASIEQAADYYIANHKPVKERITLLALLEKCMVDKELQGLSPKYLSQFGCSCRSFIAGRGHLDVGAVTREMLKSWIMGNQWAPKTQRVYLGDVRALFSWAITENYLAKSPIEGRDITLSKMEEADPQIFSPEQIKKLFTTALNHLETGLNKDREYSKLPVYRPLIGYLALATFAGIRPHELSRMSTSILDLKGKMVALDGKITKTSDRRVVELSDNCIAWLVMWRKEFPNQERITPPSWDRHLKKLRIRAGLVPWPHDVLRHCFASYYHAKHKDKSKLQALMGHSQDQDTLERHYRAVRTPDGRPLTSALTEIFWKIRP